MPLTDTGHTSAVEGEPADLVTSALIVQHEVPHFRRQLITLPAAFGASGLLGCRLRH